VPPLAAGAPAVYELAAGLHGVTLPPDPIQLQPDYDSAKAAFEAQKPIRVLFDNGAGSAVPGNPYPAFEQSFDAFPVPGTKPRPFYLNSNGTLTGAQPSAGGEDSFTLDPSARNPTDFTGDTGGGTNGLWTATPPYNWQPNPSGTAAAYVTQPLTANTTVLGAGALTAWVKSSKPDPDLQVTVSEVRPDGKEVFVQSGWLRATGRKLDKKKSTELEPVLSLRKRDDKPMPKGKYVKLTVPLYYQGHAYRAGSQIKVTISAVDGDQPIWAFAEATGAGAKISIAHSPDMPSQLLLPEVSGVNVTGGLPPCPGLRAEPCRDYVPYVNTSGSLKN
jgi:predicted acyl esterase